MNGATLEACQRNAFAPTPVGVAVHIVCEAARALGNAHVTELEPPAADAFVHGDLCPRGIFLHDDGTVEIAPPAEGAHAEARSSRPDYLAPEQVEAGAVDARADVFTLGVILWELLTASRLFARETAAATRIAIAHDPIFDVRDVTPEVPEAISEVVAVALAREPNDRFTSVHALYNALLGARALSHIPKTTNEDVARWATECARRPPRASSLPTEVPDLDIPGASRAHRSLPKMAAVHPLLIPDLRASSVEPMPSSARDLPDPESFPRPSPLGGASVAHGGGREIAFEDDDDDFDMPIERNFVMPVMSAMSEVATAPRPSSGTAARQGLDLAQPSRMVREGRERPRYEAREPSVAVSVLAAGGLLVLASGTAFVMLHQLHRTGGRNVTAALPSAFDGSSATSSGAVALVSLAIALAVGFVGLKLKPHAWAITASGGALLLLALAMVTVTLASTGESPTPPDGVLLVPYLVPASLLLFAAGLYERSIRVFARREGARRGAALPLAALAGALAFAAVETSRFAH